ncbi:unnamed protein product [Arabidopsis lyrata]|nr:unnamed protein product [Arabidopsis lyrata]
MGIPKEIPPVLKTGVDVSRGASFAVADTSILGNSETSMTLNQQVNIFRSIKSNWTDDFIGRSLFMIYIGTEDYLNFTKNKFNADARHPCSALQAFVISAINQLKIDINLLHSLKASKFAIQLLAPLGCLPISRQEYKTGNECYEPLNDLVKQHNEKIGPMLHDLAKKKLPVFSSPSLISTTLLFVGQIGILTTCFTCQTRHVVVWERTMPTVVVW